VLQAYELVQQLYLCQMFVEQIGGADRCGSKRQDQCEWDFSAGRPGCPPSFLIEEYEQHCTDLYEDPEFHMLD